MARRLKILVQTTIPRRPDDWSTESLTLMRRELAAIEEAGLRFDVVARDRAADPATPDPVLSRLHETDFDELWLFALDGERDRRPRTAPVSPASGSGVAAFSRRATIRTWGPPSARWEGL